VSGPDSEQQRHLAEKLKAILMQLTLDECHPRLAHAAILDLQDWWTEVWGAGPSGRRIRRPGTEGWSKLDVRPGFEPPDTSGPMPPPAHASNVHVFPGRNP
jgi:hypothetical protein